MGFARFMATGISRSIRMVTGVALIAFGPLRVKGVRGGAIAGSFDVCVLAPLLRVPFKGSDVRVPADGPDDTPVDTSVW